jgi:hypothetical protein
MIAPILATSTKAEVFVVGQVDGQEGRNNLIAVRQLLNPPDQSGGYHPAHRPQ